MGRVRARLRQAAVAVTAPKAAAACFSIGVQQRRAHLRGARDIRPIYDPVGADLAAEMAVTMEVSMEALATAMALATPGSAVSLATATATATAMARV